MVCHSWCRLTPEGLLLLSVLSTVIILSSSGLILGTSAAYPNDQDRGGDDDADQGGAPHQNIISRREVLRIRNKRDGSWSDWSAWSGCSRTCGGGIRTQTRQCQIRKIKSSKSSSSSEILSSSSGASSSTSTSSSSDVSRYARNVSSRHCEGHATRHHLCNTQDCPVGTIDFRESQCKAFDNRPFMGKVYQWESFMDERSPCSLTCRAKGFRFFATLNKSVIDGTRCTKPSQLDVHVCIGGSCTPIGCDDVAGSMRRLDMCGICGGDNSTCRLVSGIFTRPKLSLGYNVVAHIPKGACNLNISELRYSANHLALRRLDGSYIFNGDLNRPSWPGVYEDGSGTKFQYSRSDLNKAMSESISSAGPLKEPLDLVVMVQQPNPGIKYEYILPAGGKDVIPGPVPPVPLQDTPVVMTSGRLTLAATSRPGDFVKGPEQLLSRGGGRAAFNSQGELKSLGSSMIPPEHSNGQHHQRQHHHHHGHGGHHRRRSGYHGGGSGGKRESADNPGGKKFYWKITGYTNCSEICGGGVQRSIIRCLRSPLGNPVSDRRCTSGPDQQEKPPGQTIRCNLKPCPAEWVVGEWSNCSAECGEGFKTRSIHCQQRISPTLTMQVNEGACLQMKPAVRAQCQLKSCHHWEASEWGKCSSKCGNGVRKRSVACVDYSSKTLGDDAVIPSVISAASCEASEKPAGIKPCNMGPCQMASDWFASEWSTDCSQRCGGGIQTRDVVCSGVHKYKNASTSASSELQSNSVEEDDDSRGKDDEDLSCDDSKRPDSERECFSDRSCGEAVWFAGPWGDCSVHCGKGLRSRQVLCIIFSRGKFKVVTDSLCPLHTKPEEKEPCESSKLTCPSRWFSSEWSECSAVCGGGLQKRWVSCRSSNWTLPSTLCSDKDRPLERRSCNEHKCSLLSSPSPSILSSSPSSKLNNSLRNANTDPSGMVKDKPLQQQAAGTPTSPLPLPPRSSSSTNRTASHLINSNSYPSSNSKLGLSSSSPSVLSTTSSPPSSGSHHQELNEEPAEDADRCEDQYRNCALVVQARLCRYKYYRSVCCNSCAESDPH